MGAAENSTNTQPSVSSVEKNTLLASKTHMAHITCPKTMWLLLRFPKRFEGLLKPQKHMVILGKLLASPMAYRYHHEMSEIRPLLYTNQRS